jgi:hypothetical protein
LPTFCRHNRFVERCPICSKTLAGASPGGGGSSRAKSIRSVGSDGEASRRRRVRNEKMRVHREGRAEDDGYHSDLVPGIRASADALRLVEEISFASGRVLALGMEPSVLYSEACLLAGEDLEQASWMCFLIAYLSPLEDDDPFAGIRMALARMPGPPAGDGLSDLEGIPLGPRTSHDPERETSTLLAYRHWAERAGNQAQAFEGDPAWSPQRRFERCFERLSLPGFGRMGRYDLLVTLGRLGLYELEADSLHFSSIHESPAGDLATLAAKRAFAIGDPLNLERRARMLAEAISVPIETLDLALANWGSGARATLGFRRETCDRHALERSREALEL